MIINNIPCSMDIDHNQYIQVALGSAKSFRNDGQMISNEKLHKFTGNNLF